MSILQPIAIIVGVVSGVSGLALGILNYWHQRYTTRPHLVVRLAALAAPQQKVQSCLVQICNVGQMPVRMTRIIGFQPKRGQKGSFIVSAAPTPSGKLTEDVELGPQNVTTLQCDVPDLPKGWGGQIFVRSVIGDTFKVNRRDMRTFCKRLIEQS